MVETAHFEKWQVPDSAQIRLVLVQFLSGWGLGPCFEGSKDVA